MTFSTHGFRATNLDTWPWSFGSVTRTICIFPTRGFSWTMRGSRDSVFQSRMPSPLTHRLIHPVRRKRANKRTRQSTAGDAYVVGRYRDDNWDPDCPGPSMPFVPLAALIFLLGCLRRLQPTRRSGVNPPAYGACRGRHHRSAVVQSELRAMLGDLHT